jgi:N-hydroxyarylamine O-acetyltransferase
MHPGGMPQDPSALPDLDAYFRRIGYTGSREPSLATLNGILESHIRSIPFENLSVLLGETIALDVLSLERKLVHGRRGGYCFEQNGYLEAVLQALGFKVTPLSARVRIQQPREAVPPRTHLFLRVDLDGVPWMADVGIGGLSPGWALRLEEEGEQETPWETRRLARVGRHWFHQARLGMEWADLTEFSGDEMPQIDREVGNWWTSTSAESKFRKNLAVAVAGKAGQRRAISNNEFVVRRGVDVLERRVMGSNAELISLLEEQFGIHIPESSAITAANLAWTA